MHELLLPTGLKELHLFAGAGGGILGGMLLGHTCVCAVEIEPYPRQVLLQRQRDGILPKFPIWDDVTTFDGRPWRGLVDVVCGGFPCQDISTAGGPNRKGLHGKRSGLWVEMARIICEIRPKYAFMENSPALTFRGLNVILGDLAEMGYDARWGVFSAADIGARHERERIWIVAGVWDSHKNTAIKKQKIYEQSKESIRAMSERLSAKPEMVRKSNGLADGVDRLAAIGNGQVPAVVRLAWETLTQEDKRL